MIFGHMHKFDRVYLYIMHKIINIKKVVMSVNSLEKILKLIREKGISEKQFLADLKFDRTALSQWKKGQNESYKKYISRIADYFGVTTDYLLIDGIEAPAKKLKWEDLDDVSFKSGVDKLTDAGKEKALSYISYLLAQEEQEDIK